MATSYYIPDDILIPSILKKLPPKSIFRFKCVCKAWKHLFERPEFAYSRTSLLFTSHDNPSSLYLIDVNALDSPSPCASELPLPFHHIPNVSDITIECSCNGLFLLCVTTGDWCNWDDKYSYFLWNPFNPNAFRELDFRKRPVLKFYGFGYDHHSDDYKILLTRCFNEPDNRIYGLKTNTSKHVTFPAGNNRSTCYCSVYFRNCLHWQLDCINSPTEIHSFDLHDESWTKFDIPYRTFKRRRCTAFSLDVYGGFLGIVIRCLRNRRDDVWIMKEYGVEKSWTMFGSWTKFIRDTRTKQIVWYNPQLDNESSIKKIEIEGGLNIRLAKVFLGSLVPVPVIPKEVKRSEKKRRTE